MSSAQPRSILVNEASFRSLSEGLLDQSRYGEAKIAFSSIQSSSVADIRAKEHGLARVAFREGRYEEALALLVDIKERLGNHVWVLSNICMCLYHLERFTEWEAAFQELLSEFESAKARLSAETYCRIGSNIGKTLEEMGEIRGALDIYREALQSVDSLTHPTEHYLLLAQLLRVESSFSSAKSASKTHCELVRLKTLSPNAYIGFQIQHALLIAEIHLYGVHHARVRLRELLDRDDLCEEDRRLCFYDFLEECALSKRVESSDHGVLPPESNLSTYEKFLHRFLIENREFSSQDLGHLLKMSRSLSKAGLIRCLALALLKSKAHPLSLEIRKRIFDVLGTLSPRSRRAWLGKLKGLDAPGRIDLLLSASGLRAGDGYIDLSRNPSLLSFLSAFRHGNEQSNDAIADELWGCDYNSSHYHRIRLAASRLNRIILELTGVPKAFRVTKDRTALDPCLWLSYGS